MGRHGGLQHGPRHDDEDVHDSDPVLDAEVRRRERLRDRLLRREQRDEHPHDHAHGHSHGPVAPTTPRTRLVLAALLGPMLLIALIGMAVLWPHADEMPESLPFAAAGADVLEVEATGSPDPATQIVDATLDGEAITVTVAPEVIDSIHAGDRLRVLYIPEAEIYGSPYVFVDFAREIPLWILAALYILVVALVARWRGLAAIVGLVGAGAMILVFTLPALLTGQPGLPVALVTAAVVMFIVLYVAHGFTARTSTALLGTLIGLAFTAGIGWLATQGTSITGTATEDARLLLIRADLDLQQVFLCGLVLAGMGVLNDVTITQASAVWELRAASPLASRRELFGRAMRIGRDHIASTVYTIAFAYVGAALPVLMIMVLTEAPGNVGWTTGQVAEEIVRTLVGSIGLVLAIPITTAIAAVVVPSPAELEEVEEEAAADASGEIPVVDVLAGVEVGDHDGLRDDERPDPAAEDEVRRQR
ncbi:YibE/F-like protein [Agrococcus jejuensis]|uniref:YibE/F-like protein n=2 Tax=Agrococcus jejuensis TaxID=399736 RepID=A0A1G8GYA7_9MICO|nr:YibE/F-like protein [Agrococcus jejuensis]